MQLAHNKSSNSGSKVAALEDIADETVQPEFEVLPLLPERALSAEVVTVKLVLKAPTLTVVVVVPSTLPGLCAAISRVSPLRIVAGLLVNAPSFNE